MGKTPHGSLEVIMLNPTEVLLFIDRCLIKLFKRKETKRGLSYDADTILLLLRVYCRLEGNL